jgi:hypothetical protein
MDIKLILNPVKTLKLKLQGQEVKVTLKGTTPAQEAYIEAPKFKQYKTDRAAQMAGAEYVRRVICSTIKKVEGLSYLDENNNKVEFKVEFCDDNPNEMTEDCYNKLMRIIDLYADEDSESLTDAIKFYNENRTLPKTVGIESKKKPSKK